MSLGNVDLFGLYVAPIAPILLIAAVAFVVVAPRYGRFWDPEARLASGFVRIRNLCHSRFWPDALARQSRRMNVDPRERCDRRRRRARQGGRGARAAVAARRRSRRADACGGGDRRRARLFRLARLYGDAVDPRRDGARLCRVDRAADRRADCRTARARQCVRPQGRSPDADRPGELCDRRAAGAGERSAGEGARAERRRRMGAAAKAERPCGDARGAADLRQQVLERGRAISGRAGGSGHRAAQPQAHAGSSRRSTATSPTCRRRPATTPTSGRARWP